MRVPLYRNEEDHPDRKQDIDYGFASRGEGLTLFPDGRESEPMVREINQEED
jgi:hypothetical protein